MTIIRIIFIGTVIGFSLMGLVRLFDSMAGREASAVTISKDGIRTITDYDRSLWRVCVEGVSYLIYGTGAGVGMTLQVDKNGEPVWCMEKK